MVEANPAGDGINRHIEYATFRTDVPAKEGYSAELISNRVDPQYFDNLDGIPYDKNCDTMLKIFQRNCAERGNEPFLGTRAELPEKDARGKTQFGDYTWQTYNEIDAVSQNLAKGVMKLDMSPQLEAEGKQWRFLGIWAKNRWEWTTSLLACMHYNITTVGFYDAMSAEQVDFILKQTEMQTIVCSEDYAKKLIDMKKGGMASKVKAMIVLNEVQPALLQEAQEQGVEVRTFQNVCQEGETGNAPAFQTPVKDDTYIFSYTSGTTGDSKGVKLTHNNVLSNARSTTCRVDMQPGEAIISYLPYTHSFEQALFGFCLQQQVRIGFFSGNPAQIVEDCGKLRPTFFPSVPRLYNKIYAKLKAKLEEATGCKRWLANKAVTAKEAAYAQNGAFTHGCYDSLVFNKMKAMLGGQVRYMVTGSAPIDKTVIDFLKICFCCPILEGYGLTESCAGSCFMDQDDTITGHVGGPVESVKLRLKDLPEMNYLSTDKPYPRGEICMQGPSIFAGYFKRPDKTAEAFTDDGWFLTGDVGMVFPNGSIKIIDRSKNIFKLSQGEYIAPEKIEQIMTLSAMIEQTFLYGDSFKNACVAVVIPDKEWVTNWARSNNVTASFEEMCTSNADLKKVISDDMLRLSKEKKLTSLEKPKQFILWHEPCSIENNLITSTFKLKRNVAKDHFKPQIDVMYEKVAADEAAFLAANPSRA